MARRLALVLAVLVLAGAASLAGGPTVYLKPLAVVPPGAFSLATIAEVVAGDAREAAELASLELGSAPERPTYLPLPELRRRVARGFNRQLDLIGGGTALLPAGAVPAGREAQLAALLEFLGREDGGGGRLEVELLSALPPPDGPGFALGFTRRLQGRLAGRTQVLAGNGSVLVYIRNYLPVAHAAGNLPRDRLLTEEDVEYRELDISSLTGRFLTAGDLGVGFRVVTPIARGSALDPSRLSRSFLVRSGDRITVHFLRPGLSVSVRGKALGSGGLGEEVEVALAGGSGQGVRRFRGRVNDMGEVVVEQL